jgi:S-DNA-T family DNA segregation ATPase FtsK/SpoIIIE
VDVVRRDTLTGGLVAWADQDKETLSIWEPVHWGVSEMGVPVRLSLVERAVLIGGNRGAGKSSGINVLVAHAAKSPDVELLLIDANKVQLSPWRDRALVFADHSPDDAIDVVRLWRDEIDRRLDLLTSLPGIPLALTRDISAAHNLPVWLLVIDELAYHMSVAGTKAQQTEFYTILRDGVARGRAAGAGAIVATQRPTGDLIPTSLRDLFDIRVAYRTMTRTSSDVILGDDWSKQGYSATDIDIQARGVCWLFAEGNAPVRTKSAWISPETRADLSVTTVRFRPTAGRPESL